jgi:hypothetical protein
VDSRWQPPSASASASGSAGANNFLSMMIRQDQRLCHFSRGALALPHALPHAFSQAYQRTVERTQVHFRRECYKITVSKS